MATAINPNHRSRWQSSRKTRRERTEAGTGNAAETGNAAGRGREAESERGAGEGETGTERRGADRGTGKGLKKGNFIFIMWFENNFKLIRPRIVC